ncbi:PDDEXK nuclease domain-containing protein [Pedobacter sp. MW01-1-1]|uniref:PDDEXK nuclease domain-containing protein n=1 Tax=Pedobacter sp. MW01-1-1 TaxID=3383027 RepID=UPI003FEE83E9
MEDNKVGILFKSVKVLIEESRKSVINYVNTALVFTYFQIGRIIVEDEQDGLERAGYAKQTLKLLSEKLNQEFGKGYSVNNLENMRLFYIEYGKSETLSRISENPFKLSWSHYVQLLKIKNLEERNFYEIETFASSWGVRELKRQYHSSLFERLAISKKKEELFRSSLLGELSESPIDAMKSPYILEFLDLKDDYHYSENDLETAIINKLEQFMLELGKGFLHYQNKDASFEFTEEGGPTQTFETTKRRFEHFKTKNPANPNTTLYRTFTIKPWRFWEWWQMIAHSEPFRLPFKSAS